MTKDYLDPEDFSATSTIRRSYFEINKNVDRLTIKNILYILIRKITYQEIRYIIDYLFSSISPLKSFHLHESIASANGKKAT